MGTDLPRIRWIHWTVAGLLASLSITAVVGYIPRLLALRRIDAALKGESNWVQSVETFDPANQQHYQSILVRRGFLSRRLLSPRSEFVLPGDQVLGIPINRSLMPERKDLLLAGLAALPEVRWLRLDWNSPENISDDHLLASFLRSSHLQHLGLCQSNLTDTSLARLLTIPSLRSLRLDSCNQLRFEVPVTIAERSTIRFLAVAGPGITDLAMPMIGRMQQIDALQVVAAPVSTEGLRQLNLPRLRSLYLQATGTDDGRLDNFAQLPLEEINVVNSELGDLAVASLVQCRSLRKVMLFDTGVTSIGLSALIRDSTVEHLSLVDLSPKWGAADIVATLPHTRARSIAVVNVDRAEQLQACRAEIERAGWKWDASAGELTKVSSAPSVTESIGASTTGME